MQRIKSIMGAGVAILLFHFAAVAQPKLGAVVYGAFGNEFNQGLVAKVTAVNGNQFTVRFQHSGSDYTFGIKPSAPQGMAEVVSTRGGKFAKGTAFSYSEYRISEDTYECILKKDQWAPVMVKFPDGKSFMGHIKEFTANGGTTIAFWHSWSTYSFDKDGIVTAKTAGAYAVGTQVKMFCADVVFDYPSNLKPPHLMEPKLN